MDPEEVFGAIFGGERFLPFIVVRDAKGREVISSEEKARRDEKARKVAAEVRLHRRHGRLLLTGLRCIESCGVGRARAETRREFASQAVHFHRECHRRG